MRSRRNNALMAARAGLIACAVALCAALLAPGGSRADAEPLDVALEYTAAPDCPDVGDFKTTVTNRLGYDPFRDGASQRVVVQIASRPPAFEGRIEWRDAEGKWVGDRTFPSRSGDCRELGRAMAFALALQIQLSATAPADTQPTAEVAALPPAPAPVATAPRPSEPATVSTLSQTAESPDRGPRPVLAVGAGAWVGFGVSSSAVPFGRVFGNLAWPHWSLELSTEVGLPTTERRADGAGFSQQELLLGVAGCGAVARWSACLLAKGGAIHITGQNIDVAASPWGPIFEAGFRLAMTQPIGRRFYLAARAEGLLIVTRWRVTLDQTPVWTSSRFAENLGLDLGVRFP